MSYFDANGFFWVTQERERARGERTSTRDALRARLQNMSFMQLYEPPPLQDPPPGQVALDFETEDPGLAEGTRGASWAFEGEGEILGVALAWEGFEAYYSFAHSAGNVDAEPVWAFLKQLVLRPDIELVCANATYDIGWLRRRLGVYPRGTIRDIQFMAALLDEYRFSYGLDAIARDELKTGKFLTDFDALETSLRVKHTDMMSCLKHVPAGIVAPYAIMDARLTYNVFNVLKPKIETQGLTKVHELESKLIPMSTEMRRIGIPVDVDEATALRDEIANIKIPAIKDEIKRLTGIAVEPWVATTCEAALNTIGVTCARTRNDSPEVTAALLNQVAKKHPVGQHILDLRKCSKILTTFLEGHVLSHQEKGRIHAEFNQLRSERDDESGFGTVSGRYSSNNPNLQQIPDRDPYWGPRIRGLFKAEQGQQLASLDYSSQEPRLTVHFAAMFDRAAKEHGWPRIMGSEEAVKAYNDNPLLDYHQFVADLCGIPRKDAKSLNLGLAYGMGGAKLARSLGLPTQWMSVANRSGRATWTPIEECDITNHRAMGCDVVEVAGEEAKKIIDAWDRGAPFIRGLYKRADETAKDRGFICTLLRRRCRFQYSSNGGYAWTHKALNRLAQGSAADQTKLGLLLLWEAGVVPRITIHDENVFSVADKAQAESYMPYMRDAVQLLVPTIVDVKMGKTWGDIPK